MLGILSTIITIIAITTYTKNNMTIFTSIQSICVIMVTIMKRRINKTRSITINITRIILIAPISNSSRITIAIVGIRY